MARCPALRERTAILVPVYNEDPTDVCAPARGELPLARGDRPARCLRLLHAERHDECGDRAARRRSPGRGLRERLQAAQRLFYRRREATPARRPATSPNGSRRAAPHYAHMIVLDADSLMRRRHHGALAALMEANPQTGIIQTHIVPAGRETLFARALQFSLALTGVVLAMGNSFWQMSEANYFGHNAILRVSAFADCCRLPVLSRQAAARRRDPEPRLRRGGLPAPRRLVLLAAARAARQLRGGADQPARLRRARPPLGAGQPAARAADRRARPALDEPAASRHGHLRLPRLAAVAGHAAAEQRPGGRSPAHRRRLFRLDPHALPAVAAVSAGRRSTACSADRRAAVRPQAARAGAAAVVDAQCAPLRRAPAPDA